MFAEGSDHTPARIAHEAGVGVGTLYRHFPTQESLVVAAHRRQLALVCDLATDLASQHPGNVATRLWLEQFLNHAKANSNMCSALNAVIASGANPYGDAHELLEDAVSVLLEMGAKDATLRADVSADVALLLVGGVTHAAQHSSDQQLQRLVDLFMDALAV
ncbi:TetR family transcriptional regulator [Mycolicibacterium arabiense]|uniref:TetR family transcriptional regulator n=2 Tax=Mycolicibacterium arabiense TaxID=1286181 RepID=A0A7I7RX72_9MYCO|nr:TetR family transcriptional regulator [Mycolicibacterium arabiense]